MLTGLSSVIDLTGINPELHALLEHTKLNRKFVSGAGSRLVYDDGTSVLDFVAGYGALPLGHSPEAIHQSLSAALLDGVPCMVQPHFPEAAVRLSHRLLALPKVAFDRVVFANSGAEAVEVALKAARMASGRHKIVSMYAGFHGKTRGAMSVTDMAGRGVWSGKEDGTIFVPLGNAQALEDVMRRDGSQIAAIIIEPIQGEGGINCADVAYFKLCETLCHEHGAFLILDEVQTGFGRTGTVFSQEWLGITPDSMAVGKALGGGVMPISATYLSERMITPVFALQHSSTFAGNKFSAVAGISFLDQLEADNFALLDNVTARSAELAQIHDQLLTQFPNSLGAHRGRGLLRGLELKFDESFVAGRAGSIFALAQSQGNLPLLVAAKLLSEGIRVAPTLRQAHTLRIEPPLTIKSDEVAEYGRVVADVLGYLETRNSAEVLTHFVGPVSKKPQAQLLEPTAAASREVNPGEGHFAFILHPLTEGAYVEFDPQLGAFSKDQLSDLAQSFANFVAPFHVSRVHLQGKDGSTCTGDYIVVPYTAQQLLDMSADEARDAVQSGVDLALSKGAKVVGLGGYTSVVTKGGKTIDAQGATLTTGNSYTVMSAMNAATLASEMLGFAVDQNTVAIVGSAGSIGSGLIGLAGCNAKRLLLCVNPKTPMQKSRRRIESYLRNIFEALQKGILVATEGSILDGFYQTLGPDRDVEKCVALAKSVLGQGMSSGIEIVTDLATALPQANLVFVATSSTDTLVQPDMLRPGSVICDLSRPGNISLQARDTRPDLLIIDGGIVAFPERPELGLQIGMPRGVAFACMAETAMLGLKKHYEMKEKGPLLDFEYVQKLNGFASELGFQLADLRSFDRPLGRIDWANIKQNTEQGLTAQNSVTFDSAPEREGSITKETLIDFYDGIIGSKVALIPDAIAIVSADGQTESWAELDAYSGSYARQLRDLGVDAGARVAVTGSNSIPFVRSIAALWRLGATPVLVDARLEKSTIAQLLKTSGATLCVGDCESAAAIDAYVPMITTDVLNRAELGQAPQSAQRPATDLAVITFTSGSSGTPKAVGHAVRDLVNTSVNYGVEIVGLSAHDKVMALSRLTFTFGFNIMQMALWHGATMVLAADQFDVVSTVKRLEEEQPTLLFGVPTVFKLILRKSEQESFQHNMRLCISAGEPLPVSVADAWERFTGTRLIDGLGTSEAISTFVSERADCPSVSHIGRLVSGFDMKICRTDGTPVLDGEAGIAWVRGNAMCDGYLNDPENTAKLFDDGWCKTNDILRRDHDGNYHYLGRGNEMVKVGGIWMSPLLVEEVLARHLDIAECAVVLKEDEPPLVRPYAFVCLKRGITPAHCSANSLKQHIAASLSQTQIPHEIFFIEELPKTLSQKIERFKLSEQVDDEIQKQKHAHPV